MIIAMDFDGTIQLNDGRPNMKVINSLKNSKRNGARLILWTCREGNRLAEAVRYCAGYGLRFDAINQNVPESIKSLGYDPRKVLADIYIDDKAVR